MATVYAFLNSILPFADPTRPLWQDIVLSALLCSILYVAPQVNFDSLRVMVRSMRIGRRTTVEEPQDAGPRPYGGNFPAGLTENAVQAPHGGFQEHLPQRRPESPRPNDALENQPHDRPETVLVDQARPQAANREVGAKKAKSIARRNQQRAYNEFMREQGDQQRAEWASLDQERNKELEVERERRKAAEARLREKERRRREARKTAEATKGRVEAEASARASAMIEARLRERQFVSLREVADTVKRDEDWVVMVVKRNGFLGIASGGSTKTATILTRSGWLLRISEDAIKASYRQAGAICEETAGLILWAQFGRLLQKNIVES